MTELIVLVNQTGRPSTWMPQFSDSEVVTLITDMSFTKANQGCMPGDKCVFTVAYVTCCLKNIHV